MAGDDARQGVAIADDEPAHGVEAAARAGDVRLARRALHADATADQRMMAVILLKQLRKSRLIRMRGDAAKLVRDRGDDLAAIQRPAADHLERNDALP